MTRQQIWQAGYFDGLAGDPPRTYEYTGKEDVYMGGYERGRRARMDTPEEDRERPSRRPNPYEPTEERVYMPNPVAPKVSGYEGMTVKYETRRQPGFAFGQAVDFVDFADKTGLLDEVRERFYAFYLNQGHKLQGYRLIGAGGRSFVEVDPVIVFGPAVALHSSAVTVLHNHPSGGLTFGRDDRLATYRMIRAGLALGIRILDHVVVSVTGHISMEESGLLAGLLDKAKTATHNELNEIP